MPLHTRKDLRGIVFGMLLGDSWLTKHGHLGCEQVTLELIALKRRLLEELLGREITVSTRHRSNQVIYGRLLKSKRTYSLRVCSGQFKKYYKVLYKNGKRRLTASMLRRLSLQGLAIWLMDDGYLDYHKSNDTRYLVLCTDSYNELEHALIITYFKSTFGIECFIRPHVRYKDAQPTLRIAFNGHNAQKLIAMIYKFILPCFYYKIDLKYKRMDSKNILVGYREAIKYISQNETYENTKI